MVTTVLAVAGALVAVPGALVVAAFCLYGIWDLWERFTETFRVQGAQRQWQLGRDRIMSDSFWFSEDEPTMKLIQALSEGRDVSQSREEWRQRRTKAEEN